MENVNYDDKEVINKLDSEIVVLFSSTVSFFIEPSPVSSFNSNPASAWKQASRYVAYTVVSGQTNPDWDCLQANHMSSSFKNENLILFVLDP